MKPNEKHLEFLQSNISRMNQCSFQMKGWAITLASALIAVFVSTISEIKSISMPLSFQHSCFGVWIRFICQRNESLSAFIMT